MISNQYYLLLWRINGSQTSGGKLVGKSKRIARNTTRSRNPASNPPHFPSLLALKTVQASVGVRQRGAQPRIEVSHLRPERSPIQVPQNPERPVELVYGVSEALYAVRERGTVSCSPSAVLLSFELDQVLTDALRFGYRHRDARSGPAARARLGRVRERRKRANAEAAVSRYGAGLSDVFVVFCGGQLARGHCHKEYCDKD